MVEAGSVATLQNDATFTVERYSTIFLCSSPAHFPAIHFLLHCTGSLEVKLGDLWALSCLQKETYEDPVLVFVLLH